jgi:dTDP-4-amino-4,6-dideoxygalactose transaminase
MVGWNCRMDGIQAAVLQIKLRHLDAGNARRRAVAAQYESELAGVPGLVTPSKSPNLQHVYHVYAIRTPERDEVIRSLAQNGVGSGIHYPVPVHLQSAYSGLGYGRGDFPKAERCAEQFISLPMFPELTGPQVSHVVQTLTETLCAGVMA